MTPSETDALQREVAYLRQDVKELRAANDGLARRVQQLEQANQARPMLETKRAAAVHGRYTGEDDGA